MPKFCANVSTMYSEYPVLERFEQARNSGFDAVEFLFPYAYELDELALRLDDAELKLVLINAALGNPEQGQRGIGAIPGLESEFQSNIDQAFRYASRLGAEAIHVMAGIVSQDQDRERYEETFVTNLAKVADDAQELGIDLLLEPLNLEDSPGYLLTNSDHAMRLIREVDKPNVKLQYDFYHMQIMEGDLGRRVTELLSHIGHIQFSSRPGRHEPQYGEVNVDYLFNLLDDLNYQGYVGCEYSAKGTTQEGLCWASHWGINPVDSST